MTASFTGSGCIIGPGGRAVNLRTEDLYYRRIPTAQHLSLIRGKVDTTLLEANISHYSGKDFRLFLIENDRAHGHASIDSSAWLKFTTPNSNRIIPKDQHEKRNDRYHVMVTELS